MFFSTANCRFTRWCIHIYIYICICISLYRVLLDTYYFLCKLYSHPIAFPWTPGKSMVNPSTFSKIEHPWLSHHLWCLSHHSYCLNYHFYCLNLHFLVTKNCPKPPFVPKAFAKRASKRTPRDMEAWTPAQSLPRKKTPSSGESLKRVTRTQLIFCVYSIDMYVHRYIVIYIYICSQRKTEWTTLRDSICWKLRANQILIKKSKVSNTKQSRVVKLPLCRVRKPHCEDLQ